MKKTQTNTKFDRRTYQTPLPPSGQALLEWFRERGYQDDSYRLDLSAPIKDPMRVSCTWFLRKWQESCIEHKNEFGGIIYYAYAASRGATGNEPWSMHVVFQVKPQSLEWFKNWWKEKYGGTCEIRKHPNSLRYFVKNCLEQPGQWDLGKQQRSAKKLSLEREHG